MYRVILPLLIILCITITFADSAVQTDWSGGDGIYGPVIDWGIEFYFNSDTEWNLFPGNLILTPLNWIEFTIAEDFDGAWSAYSADIDSDGDMDVIGAAFIAFDVIWWENEDGSGELWTEHVIDANFNSATSVYAQDINGDGKMDVLGAAYGSDEVVWWENSDGFGTSWIEHVIDDDFWLVRCIHSEDIDGDGDMDVIGASEWTMGAPFPNITWWENDNGSGEVWTEHPVDSDFDGAISVYSEDIDGDGDMDLLGASPELDEVSWWENEDGVGESWIKHLIDDDFDGAMSAHSGDLDSDGDMDVLGAAFYADDIIWWENEIGSGTSWIEHTIDGDFNGVSSVHSDDIDSDGDTDILGASWPASDDDGISWWENVGGSGSAWIEHPVDKEFPGLRSVLPVDLNGDGLLDVVGASDQEDVIAWWGLGDYSTIGYLESSILDTQANPDWDYIEWSHESASGTSISFHVRASNDYMAMGDWSDTIPNPCILDGILIDGDRYVQYQAILETIDPDSTPVLFNVMITWDPMGIEGSEESAMHILLPFSPNPASEPAVCFGVPEPSQVLLSLYDLSGRMVTKLSDIEYQAGYHSITLDYLSPGIYFCRMTSGDFTATQRFVVID